MSMSIAVVPHEPDEESYNVDVSSAADVKPLRKIIAELNETDPTNKGAVQLQKIFDTFLYERFTAERNMHRGMKVCTWDDWRQRHIVPDGVGTC